MRRILITILLTIFTLSVAFGQTSNKPSTRNAKIVGEIKQMERQWLIESYSPNDMSAFDRIIADDFMITHSIGKNLNKAQKRADIISYHSLSSAPSPDFVFKIEDSGVQVRVYKNVAISTGYIIEKFQQQGKQINDRVYFTNTYLKRNGRWQVVASQLSRVPQSQ
jgi:hypothetical protein